MNPYQRAISTLLAAACAVGGATGQSNDSPAASDAKSAAKAETTPNKKFLLLTSGRVLEGDVVKSPAGGYLLRRGGATIRYEDAMVVALADSLEQLYVVRVQMVPANDFDERFKIVDWCLANKLPDLACKELEAILTMDPGNQLAQRRYRRLTKPDLVPEGQYAAKKEEAPKPLPVDPGQIIADFKSAHGQQSFEHFRIVEAMLINRCGAAGCHGSARHAGDFKLIKPREGNLADAKMTARNLQAVLGAIDVRQPTQSPILTMALQGQKHGVRGQPPLAGINDPLFQDLKEWVFNVAESSTVERAQADTPSRRRMAMRNRSFGGRMPSQVQHPLWTTERTARGRIVLEDGTIREYGTPAESPSGNRGSYANSMGNRNNEGGDDIPKRRPGFAVNAADDAPPTTAPIKKDAAPIPQKSAAATKSAAGPTRTTGNAAPEKATAPAAKPLGHVDPNDPAAFNAQPAGAGASVPRRQATKSAVPKAIMLDTNKRGQLFEAAPGPINGRQPK